MLKSRTIGVLRAAVSSQVDRMLGRRRRRGQAAAAGGMLVDALEPRTMMARTLGIDVSQWQGTVDWYQVHAAGKEFAFARASEGNATADPTLATNMAGGAAAGMLMAAYHHAQPDASADDAVNEANFFLSTAGAYMGPGWMRPVVGVYDGSGLGTAALSQWITTFEQTIYAAKGVDPIIYTNTDYATHYLDSTVRAHDLWIANWDTTTYGDPLTTGSPPTGVGSTMGWAADDWDVWHYSATGSVPGVGGAVDLDAYKGDRAALESQFQIPGSPTFQLSVNFGPYETAAPAGYVNFADQTYGAYQGYTMGWSTSGTTLTTRTAGTAPDTRYQTYAMPVTTSGGVTTARSFEVAVPNGSYRVRIVAGSPDQVGTTYKFNVEGVSAINGVSHTGTEFLSSVVTVDVTDGKLTISSDASAPNSRLAFVDIVSAGRSVVLPAAPSGVTATPASTTAVDVRWQDNADNEGRDPATFGSSTWGQVDQGYQVERRDWNGTTWSAWTTRGYAAADAELYQDAGLTAGTQYQYRVTAVNAAGPSAAVTATVAMTPATGAQQAYTADGSPWSVPTTIQAEDFDLGGEGVAYHDTSAGNAGGAYRSGVGADVGRIRATEAGAPLTPREYYVGWMRAGEWTAYTVDVPAAGTYVMSFRVANAGSAGSGRKFHASVVQGGVETNLAAAAPGGQWDVPSTGNWNSYTTVSQVVTLPAGVQAIRLYADAAPAGNTTVMNVDWLALAPLITGARQANEGQPYAVSLPVGQPLYGAVGSWIVDWGDATSPATPANGAASVPHTYADGGSYTVTVSAVTAGTPQVMTSWVVTVADVAATSSALIGPSSANEGDTVAFSLAGTPVTGDTYSWTASRGGQTVAHGTGPDLSFTTGLAGSYQVSLTTVPPSGPSIVTLQMLTVLTTPPQHLSITGPQNGAPDNNYVFQGDATAPIAAVGPLTYAWSILQNSAPVTLPSGTVTSLSSFKSPVLSVGQYRVQLTVSDAEGQSTTVSQLLTISDENASESLVNNGILSLEDPVRTGATILGQVVQSDGRIVVLEYQGGPFNEGFGSVSTAYILARYLPDLRPDVTWGVDGKIVFRFNDLNAYPPQYTDLQPATNAGNGIAYTDLVQQPDGKLVVGAAVVNPATGNQGFALARFNATGVLDKTFGSGGQSIVNFPGQVGGTYTSTGLAVAWINSLAIEPYGGAFKILAGGMVAVPNGGADPIEQWGLVRFNSDGSPDTSFGDGGTVILAPSLAAQHGVLYQPEINAIAVDPNGKIVLAGNSIWDYGNISYFTLARLNSSDGSLDTSFGPGTGETLPDLNASQAVVFGRPGIAVTAFPEHDSYPFSFANAILVQSDGSTFDIVAVGSAGNFDDEPDFGSAIAVARYTSDGMLDVRPDGASTGGFGPGGQGYLLDRIRDSAGDNLATAATLDAAGAIYVAGSALDYWFGTSRDILFKLNSNGTLATWGDGDSGSMAFDINLPSFNTNSSINDVNIPTAPISGYGWELSWDEGSLIIGGNGAVSGDGGSQQWGVSLARYTPATETPVPALNDPSGSSRNVTLSWNDYNLVDDGMEIQRSPNGETGWATIGYALAGAITYTDSTAPAGTASYYRIRAIIGATSTDWSNVTDITTPIAPVPISSLIDHATGTPVVGITSPTMIGQAPLNVDEDTDIYGVATDPAYSITSYTLELIPKAGGNPIIIATGNSAVGGGTINGARLGTIHAASEPNGQYTLVLTATNSAGATSVAEEQVLIDTAFKDGNLMLPSTDVILTTPGGVQLPITREYDSSQANVDGDFGYGWSLNVLDSHLRLNLGVDTFDPIDPYPVLKAGDLVTLTVPDDGQHVFEFVPLPEENPDGNWAPVLYQMNFIALDGSGATLRLVSTYGAYTAYDPMHGVFLGSETSEELGWWESAFGLYPMNPAISYWNFVLTTSDSTAYTISAKTGSILSSTDSKGDSITYSTGGIIINGQTALSINQSGGRITSIQVPGQNAIEYGYDGDGNLATVQNQAGELTTYSYDDASNPHFLTAATNPQGVKVLQAVYDPATGQLRALINAAGTVMPVSTSGFNGYQTSQTFTDAAGNSTEYFYNAYGELTRKIQSVSDGEGGTNYIVTVIDYTFVSADQWLYPGLTGINLLKSIQQYAPFEVVGPDADGLRFTEKPAADAWIKQVTYNIPAYDPVDVTSLGDKSRAGGDIYIDPANVSLGQVASVSQRIDSHGTLQTTLYNGYAIVNALDHEAVLDALFMIRPSSQVTELQIPDSGSAGGYDDLLQAETFYQYDDDGNLKYSVNSLGEGQENTYVSTATLSGDPEGSTLVEYPYQQWNITASIVNGVITSPVRVGTQPTSQTTRYNLDEYTESGFAYTAPKYQTDAAGQVTFYAYSSFGQPVLQFTAKTWTTASGSSVSGWVGTITKYDSSGRVTDSYQATYLNAFDGALHTRTDGSGNVVVDVLYNTEYSAPLPTVHNDYNALGLIADSVDEYGGETVYTYDINGRAIRVQRPDGTETRTVYDVMGRPIWTTDRFAPADSDPTSSANTALSTYTVYNALGQVVETDRYSGTIITIDSYSVGSETFYRSEAATEGTLLSATKTFYDPSGRTIETISPSGLRTGTIYFPDGTVQYTGPLAGSALDGGDVLTVDGVTTRGYTIGDFLSNSSASYTQNAQDQYALDSISVTGDVHTGDPVSVRFVDGTGTLLANVTVTAPSDSAADLLSALATAINGTTALSPHLTARYDASAGRVILSPVGDSVYSESAPAGSPLTLWRAHSQTSIDANGHRTVTVSDAENRTIRTIYDDGSFTETLYGIGDQVVTEDQEGDALPTPSSSYEGWTGVPSGGKEMVTIAQRKAGDPLVVTYYLYDNAGRLTEVWQPAVIDADPNSPTYGLDSGTSFYNVKVRPHTTYLYDAAGNETAQITAGEQAAFKAWTGAGHTAASFTGDTRFAYDQNGNQVRETLPDDSSGTPERSTATYNAFGQKTISTDFDGNTNAYDYDDTARGQGRLTGKYFFGPGTAPLGGDGKIRTTLAGQSATYTYDALGRRHTVTDDSGTTTYSYDEQGNVIEEETPEGVIHYVYDPATGNHTETYTDNTDTTYGYDNQGRLTTVTVGKLNGSALADALATTYTYDPAGSKQSESLPNGITTTYTYDDLNRLTDVFEQRGTTPLFSQTYVLNDDGTRASSAVTEVQPDGSILTIDTEWTYDADQRLVAESQTTTSTASPGLAGVTPPPGGLATWFNLPAGYNIPWEDQSDGMTPMYWDGSKYAGPGGSAVLLPPSLGTSHGGNGTTQWVLYLGDTATAYSFTLSAGVLTPDGVLGDGSDDAQGITIGPAAPGYSDAYAYDLEANRVSKVHIGPGGGPDDLITYVYNGDNELTAQVSAVTGETDFTYDANGSMISQTSYAPNYPLGLNGSFGTGGMVRPGGMSYISGQSSQAVLPNGNILVVGQGASSSQPIVLSEYRPDGTPDTSFGTGGSVTTSPAGHQIASESLTVLPSGNILIAGIEYPTSGSTTYNIVLVEYNSDGSLDTSFGTGGIVRYSSTTSSAPFVSVAPDGDIILLGQLTSGMLLAKYLPDGTLDSSFGTSGAELVSGRWGMALTVLPDGHLLVAGSDLMAFNSDGSVDTTFGTSGVASVSGMSWKSMTLLADGKIVVAGRTDGGENVVAEFDASGILVSSFGTSGVAHSGMAWGVTYAVAALADGDLLLAGTMRLADHTDIALIEFRPDGTVDETFANNGAVLINTPAADIDAHAVALDVLPDGTLLVSGMMGTSTFVAEYSLGSVATSTTWDTQTTTYSYDLRNKLVSVSVNGAIIATYTYDDDGNRVAETVGGVTTLYLTDTANPTGYAQPIEAKSSATAAPTLTYLIGDRVFGQVDASGNASYLLADGHGSTRLMTNAVATVTGTFNYDAFGGAIGFNPKLASTTFLFGGDAVYDPASGTYLHGNGVRARLGFRFVQRDSYAGGTRDPITLHKYLYANANPVSHRDPSGRSVDSLLAAGGAAWMDAELLATAGSVLGYLGYVLAAATAVSIAQVYMANTAMTAAAGNAIGYASYQGGLIAGSGTAAASWVYPTRNKDYNWLGDKFGTSGDQIRDIIEEIKEEIRGMNPENTNPDVEIDPETGDVRIKGGDGEPFDNIKEHIPDEG